MFTDFKCKKIFSTNNLKYFVGARNPRFDPTAYIKDKERKKKEASMKK